MQPPAHFELSINSVKLQLEKLEVPHFLAYRVCFSSARKPLVLARALDINGHEFWTSIPEGRQKEAAGVGKLIDEYLASQNK